MTREEFMEKWAPACCDIDSPQELAADLMALLAEREAQTREACAKVAFMFETEDDHPPYRITPWADMAKKIAAAIRATGAADTA